MGEQIMKKKLLAISLLVLLCVSFAFADAYRDVNKYIGQGLTKENLEKIKALSPQLTQQQKESIYTWRKTPVLFPVLSNLFLGFGSGSFEQGDKLHGYIFLAGDVACLGVVGYNIFKNGWDNFINSFSGESGVEDDMTLAKVALFAALGLRVYQAIRPIRYANNYNSNLKDALGLTSVTMTPSYANGKMGMTLSAKISL